MSTNKEKSGEPAFAPASIEDFLSASDRPRASDYVEIEKSKETLTESFERRLTRIEEWRTLHVDKTSVLESRIEQLSEGAQYARAHMLTKDDFQERQRDQAKQVWVIAGVIVAALSLVIAAATAFLSNRPAGHNAGGNPPVAQPIIVQLPSSTSDVSASEGSAPKAPGKDK